MAFDAVGELAAQPGGQELSALVARVQQVDPEVLHGMGRRLGSMVEGVDGSVRAVRRHGDDVQGAWQGRGAEALTGYLDDFGRAGTRTLDAAGRIRVHIDDAGRELAALRGEVDAQVSRALDAARRVRSEALADPVRAPMADQLAAQAMTEPTAAARTAVERAETALGDAARALREMTADVVGFSRLPAPDARPIAPAAGGGPLGWSAIPAGESLATVPASIDGDGGTQGIDLDGGSASSDVSSVGESSSSADDASGSSGSSGGESSECSDSGASGAEESGTGEVGDSGDLPEDAPDSEEPDSGGGDASVSEASASEESGSGGVGDSSDLGDDFLEEAPDSEEPGSGGGDASVSEASASEESGSGGVGDSSDLGDDFLEEAPDSEEPDSGGGDASVSEASGVEESGSEAPGSDGEDTGGDASDSEASGADDADSAGVGDSSDLGDDFLEDTSDADAPAPDDSGADDSASQDEGEDEGEDDKSEDKTDDKDDEGSGSDAPEEDEGADAEADDAEADDAEADDAEADDAEADDAESEDGAVTGTSGDSSGSATDAGSAPAGGPQGQVGDWIREAMAVLQAEGVSLDKMDPDDIATIIEHESGGDPEATNNWDSNADKGTPSQGLMQTIGPTFDAHKLPGHGEITDPIDNIIAGVRYAIDRYGSVSQVPGVEAVARGDSYVGY
ncbi:transglycosylase SLT domain-containing protein [Actinomycetospora sp. CA-053990]|uniref:transglycosylase SLT domain-containing protein n=1 Tax=Actinomycetospora sp. CA-053990 TaxID=3239891 RepID=UPI003D8F3FEE